MRKSTSHAVATMARANLESWMGSPRTILMALFIFAICYIESGDYGLAFASFGHMPHWDELLFYAFVYGCNMRTTSVLFLITISEIPRRMAYQHQHLIRAGRTAWVKAQLLYCLWAVLFMQLLMALSMSLFLIPYTAPGWGWTEPGLRPGACFWKRNALFRLRSVQASLRWLPTCWRRSPFSCFVLLWLPSFC